MRSLEEVDSARLRGVSDHPDISPDDIAKHLVKIGHHTLIDLFQHSRKPVEAEVIAAGCLFFHRFYLQESILHFHPRSVMVAAINLAAKTEEYHAVSLSDLVNGLPDGAKLKAAAPLIEMKLLAALNYDLVTHQPWHVMLYWAEMIRRDDSDVHLRIYDAACDTMRKWLLSDAVLVFKFPQLATAAVLKACNSAGPRESPDDDTTESIAARFLKEFATNSPHVDLPALLSAVEGVVNRFGPFETLLRDADESQTSGYRALESLLDSSSKQSTAT